MFYLEVSDMDAIWLIFGVILLIPISFILYVVSQSVNNSDNENTLNPDFNKQDKKR